MKDFINFSSKLPTINKTYATFDIIGNTIGKYFDYKRETKLINAEIRKIKEQTKLIIKNIDTQLQKALDKNNKDFKKEMKRLHIIEKELQNNREAKNKILDSLLIMNMEILKMDIPTQDKIMLIDAIRKDRETLEKIFENSTKLIGSMANYNPSQLPNLHNIIDTEVE